MRAKTEYKDKVEHHYFSGNAKKTWEGLKVMMARDSKQKRTPLSHPFPSFANDLNIFFVALIITTSVLNVIMCVGPFLNMSLLHLMNMRL